MKKLILFAAASLIAGQASALAQSVDNPAGHASKHRRLMAAHARVQDEDPGMIYRAPGYPQIAPSYGYGGYGGYGPSEPDAEGRTSGG